LDLAAQPSPVHAIASGTVAYAEDGHTRWRGRGDSGFAVLIELDEPIPFDDKRITHAWYAHLSGLERVVAEDAPQKPHVSPGDKLGISGRARGAYHLHLGLLLNGDTSQNWGTYLLENDVRRVLCGLGARARLPPALPGVLTVSAVIPP
jgi:murein DD-endopeptidase MepM/ murein hydrolase activator NlpD